MAGSEAGNSRHYTIGGRKFVRVSTVLSIINKPYLLRWYGKHGSDECARLSKEATDFGHRFHACMELHAKGELFPWDVPGDMVEHVEAARAWFDANVLEVVAIEQRVHSEIHRYAGTADLIARFRGIASEEPIPADWKTSKQIGWEYGLQLSAYLEASWEMGHHRLANGRLPLWVPREQPGVIVADPLPPEEHDEDFGAFLHARGLFDIADARRKREEAAYQRRRRLQRAGMA